jgi:hypothetical protein
MHACKRAAARQTVAKALSYPLRERFAITVARSGFTTNPDGWWIDRVPLYTGNPDTFLTALCFPISNEVRPKEVMFAREELTRSFFQRPAEALPEPRSEKSCSSGILPTADNRVVRVDARARASEVQPAAMSESSKGIERVRLAFSAAGVPCDVKEMPSTTRTAQEAALRYYFTGRGLLATRQRPDSTTVEPGKRGSDRSPFRKG